jgi:hypothetical protein
MHRTLALLLALPVVALSGCADGAGPRLRSSVLGSAPGAAEPNLALAADGRVLVSWLEPTGERTHALRFAIRAPDGGWGEPRTVASGRDWFVNWADFPSVVALAGDTLAAHWLVRSGPGTYAYDVVMAISPDGGATWSEPFTPHTDGTQSEHGFVALFPAPAGGVGAVWLDGRAMAGGHEGEAAAGDEAAGGDEASAGGVGSADDGGHNCRRGSGFGWRRGCCHRLLHLQLDVQVAELFLFDGAG